VPHRLRRFQRRSLPIAMEWRKRTTTTPAIAVTTGEVTTAITINTGTTTGTIITTTDDLVAERLNVLVLASLESQI
jgi:hypothetical protein